MEDMRIESLKEVALRMLSAGKYTLKEIANISGLSLDEVKGFRLNSPTEKGLCNQHKNIRISVRSAGSLRL